MEHERDVLFTIVEGVPGSIPERNIVGVQLFSFLKISNQMNKCCKSESDYYYLWC